MPAKVNQYFTTLCLGALLWVWGCFSAKLSPVDAPETGPGWVKIGQDARLGCPAIIPASRSPGMAIARTVLSTAHQTSSESGLMLTGPSVGCSP